MAKDVLDILLAKRTSTVDVLADMTKADLKSVGIVMGDASQILRAAKCHIKQGMAV